MKVSLFHEEEEKNTYHTSRQTNLFQMNRKKNANKIMRFLLCFAFRRLSNLMNETQSKKAEERNNNLSRKMLSNTS